MAQKIIKGPVDDNSLNSTNHNFTELYNMKNVLQTQINDLVLDAGESNQEVAQARGGHQVLSDRLNETDSQLAETDNKLSVAKNNISENTNRVSVLENEFGKFGDWRIEENSSLGSLDFRRG